MNDDLFNPQDLRRFTIRYLSKIGVPEDEAKITADVIIAADLRGIPTHGITRLHSYLGRRLIQRTINAKSPLRIVNQTPTTLLLDGGNGIGQVIAHHAMTHCISMANKAGTAIVSVRNSNHFGIAGYYAMMALPHDMIGISLSNTQPLVAPTYSRKKMIGTNPLSVAIPTGFDFPFVLDMATSVVTNGTLKLYQEKNQKIPSGWGIDQYGQQTIEPSDIISGGALLPLGGTEQLRGYKGFGLSLLVDLLSGVLSGSAYGHNVGNPEKSENPGIGHFFAAIKTEYFRPIDEFKHNIDDYLQTLKAAPKIDGADRIFIPGEKEYEMTMMNEQRGILLSSEVVDGLKNLCLEVDIPFDLQPL